MNNLYETRTIEVVYKQFSYGFELKDQGKTHKWILVGKVQSNVTNNTGLKVGDKIIKINGEPVAGKNFVDIRNNIRNSPNDCCKLEILCGQSPVEITTDTPMSDKRPEPIIKASRFFIPTGVAQQKIKLFQQNIECPAPDLSTTVSFHNRRRPQPLYDRSRSRSFDNIMLTSSWLPRSRVASRLLLDDASSGIRRPSVATSCNDILSGDLLNIDRLGGDLVPERRSSVASSGSGKSVISDSISGPRSIAISQEPFVDEYIIHTVVSKNIEVPITTPAISASTSFSSTSRRPSEALTPSDSQQRSPHISTSLDIFADPIGSSTEMTTEPPLIDEYHLNPLPEIDVNFFTDALSSPMPSLINNNNPSSTCFSSSLSSTFSPTMSSSISKSSTNILEETVFGSSPSDSNLNQPNCCSMTNLTASANEDQSKPKSLKREDSTIQNIPIKLWILQYYEKIKLKGWRDYVLEREPNGARFRKRMESFKKPQKHANFLILQSTVVSLEMVSPESVSFSTPGTSHSKRFHKSGSTSTKPDNSGNSTNNNNSRVGGSSTAILELVKHINLPVQPTQNTIFILTADASHVILRFQFNPNIFQDQQFSSQAFRSFLDILSVFQLSISANTNGRPTLLPLPTASPAQSSVCLAPTREQPDSHIQKKTIIANSCSVTNFYSENLPVFSSPQASIKDPTSAKCSQLSLAESTTENVSNQRDTRHSSSSQTTTAAVAVTASVSGDQCGPFISGNSYRSSGRKFSLSASIRSGSKSSFENISSSDISAGAQPSAGSKNILNKAMGLIKPEKKSSTKTYELFTGTKAEFEEFKRQLEGGVMPLEMDPSEMNGTHFQKYIYEVPRMRNMPNLPMIIYMCTEIVETIGLGTEGIYRKTGSKKIMKNIIQNLNKPLEEIDSESEDWNNVHAICGTLKLFLRRLREYLIPADLSHKLAYSCKTVDPENAESLAKTLMDIRYHLSSDDAYVTRRKLLAVAGRPSAPLPTTTSRSSEASTTVTGAPGAGNYTIEDQLTCRWHSLRYLLGHLARVVAMRKRNSMAPQAIAICFTPVLMEAWQQSLHDVKADNEIMVKALELIITHQDWIFNDWDPVKDGHRRQQLMETAQNYCDNYIRRRCNLTSHHFSATIDNDDTTAFGDETPIDVRLLVRQVLSQGSLRSEERPKLGRRHSSHSRGQNPLLAPADVDLDVTDEMKPPPPPFSPTPPSHPPLSTTTTDTLSTSAVAAPKDETLDSADSPVAPAAATAVKSRVVSRAFLMRGGQRNSQTAEALDLSTCVDLMKRVSQLGNLCDSVTRPHTNMMLPSPLVRMHQSAAPRPPPLTSLPLASLPVQFRHDSLDCDAEDYSDELCSGSLAKSKRFGTTLETDEEIDMIDQDDNDVYEA